MAPLHGSQPSPPDNPPLPLRLHDSAAIFSPSVARIAASAARDWSYVDAWLASKLPPAASVPPFERNRATLGLLLSLAAASEAADGERQLLAQADAAALRELQDPKQDSRPDASAEAPLPLTNHRLLSLVQDHLPKEGALALDSLALLALQTELASPDPSSLGHRMLQLLVSTSETEQMAAQVETIARHIQSELHHPAAAYPPIPPDHQNLVPPGLAKQNLELQRKTKAASSLLPTLSSRPVSNSTIASPNPCIAIVARQEQSLCALRARREALEAELSAFEGLSGNPDQARAELDRLRRQLRAVAARRDVEFENLANRGSPTK